MCPWSPQHHLPHACALAFGAPSPRALSFTSPSVPLLPPPHLWGRFPDALHTRHACALCPCTWHSQLRLVPCFPSPLTSKAFAHLDGFLYPWSQCSAWCTALGTFQGVNVQVWECRERWRGGKDKTAFCGKEQWNPSPRPAVCSWLSVLRYSTKGWSLLSLLQTFASTILPSCFRDSSPPLKQHTSLHSFSVPVVSCSISQSPPGAWFPFYLMLSQCLQTCLSFPFLKRNYLPPYHPLLKQIPSLMSQLNFWKQWIPVTGLHLVSFQFSYLTFHWNPSQFTHFLFATFAFDFSGELPSPWSWLLDVDVSQALSCLLHLNTLCMLSHSQSFQLSLLHRKLPNLYLQAYLGLEAFCLLDIPAYQLSWKYIRTHCIPCCVPDLCSQMCLPCLGNGPWTHLGKPGLLNQSFTALSSHPTRFSITVLSSVSCTPLLLLLPTAISWV